MIEQNGSVLLTLILRYSETKGKKCFSSIVLKTNQTIFMEFPENHDVKNAYIVIQLRRHLGKKNVKIPAVLLTALLKIFICAENHTSQDHL